jgi:uncharacterized membrane protein YraQ (UPF0718 family)
MNSLIYISLCLILTGISFILNRKKTIAGLKRGWALFRNMLLPLVNILILVSVLIYIVPPEAISRYLGPGSGAGGFAIAAVSGAITIIPPFISYPIAASLIAEGASYAVVATFMTTLMMVGVLTLPIEFRYFDRRVAIMRNALNFLAAIIIGLVVGLVL